MVSHRHKENFYLGIWSSLPHPGFVVNYDLEIIEVNSASETYCMTSKSRIMGKRIVDFLGQSSLLTRVIRQTEKEKSPVAVHGIDVYLLGKDPDTCNVYCSPLEVREDCVLVLIEPTAKMDKIDRNLLHQNAARSVSGLAAMLGHEIRNPLAGISGAAQLLAQNACEEDLKLTNLIQSESKRIGRLVSKFEIFGDLGPIVRSSLNIHDVLEKTKDLAKASFASHIRFYEDYDPSLPNISGHFDSLVQVFLNLFKNSSEAAPKTGGTIKISTFYRSGIKILTMNKQIKKLPVTIEIVDNGKGIAIDIIDRIFEPFIGTKKAGSGLGLALVSKIIADHGGSIEYYSGEGRTTFNIGMPIEENCEEDIDSYEIHSRLLS